ncbi:MAG TPA: hypothetical protein VGR22_04415, partial [Thermomicrobiales bacterium]|nr:hypothetical protein [Thermomicrobiales bacterium]
AMSSDITDETQDAAEDYFRLIDGIPEQAWYWLALGSIGVSAALKLMDKDHWELFVGQWLPTFLLFGLYHHVMRPSQR